MLHLLNSWHISGLSSSNIASPCSTILKCQTRLHSNAGDQNVDEKNEYNPILVRYMCCFMRL